MLFFSSFLLLGRIAVLRPIITDGLAWFVCLSVTIVSPAKTAETIVMSFGLWTRVGPMNHVLDGVQSRYEETILRGKGGPL